MDNLFKILDVAINSGKEDDVTAFSLGLLEYGGKTVKNGYIIATQKHIPSGTPDICVSILESGSSLLVIECKARGRMLSNGDTQIMGYMKNGKYKHGLLVYPDKSIVYLMEEEGPDLTRLYLNKQQLREIIEYISDL
jgi:hypothetical protein